MKNILVIIFITMLSFNISYAEEPTKAQELKEIDKELKEMPVKDQDVEGEVEEEIMDEKLVGEDS